MNTGLATLLVLVLGLTLSGCSREAPVEDIDKVAGQFFERLKTTSFDEIYDDSAQQFKDNKARATVQDELKRLTESGTVRDYRRISVQFHDIKEGRAARPVYSMNADNRRWDVTLTLLDVSGEWKLLGFEAKSRG